MLKQGAEARLYLGEYNGQKCLIKERFKKEYRHPDLDTRITRQRMKAENRANERCHKANILVPKIFNVNFNERKIYMEYLDKSVSAKCFIQSLVKKYDEVTCRSHLERLCERIGKILGKLHSNNIIHGDLTTSNILINPKETNDTTDEYDIILIDFGLSHYNQGAEDKGVDLYVLERALLSTHSEQQYLFELILKSYTAECGSNGASVIVKFEEVRARGRKRTMIG